MLIHSLVTGNLDQAIDADENDNLWDSANRQKSQLLTKVNVDVEITVKQFTYIYKNKIQVALNEKEEMTSKFEFKDMNLLLSAYEYWKYENQNKKTFV